MNRGKRVFLFGGVIAVGLIAAGIFIGVQIQRNLRTSQEGAEAMRQYKTNRLATVNESYPYCNDNSLYIWKDEEGIKQYTFSGKLVKKYSFPGECEIGYVNNNEIFIIRFDADKNELNELWRVPIERKSDREQLLMEQAEKILVSEGLEPDEISTKDEIIVYCDHGIYKEYDRKKKTNRTINTENRKQRYSNLAEEPFSKCLSGDTVLLNDIEEENIYAHKIGSGKVTKIGKAFVEEDTVGILAQCISRKQYFFFSQSSIGDTPSDVWLYNSETNKKTTFLTKENIQKVLERAGIQDAYMGIDSFFADGNQLFLYVYTDNDDLILLQCRIGERADLVYNAEVNEYLMKNKQIVSGIVENTLLLEHYRDKDEVIYGVYHLATHKYTEITGEEKEKFYFHFREVFDEAIWD